MSTSVIWDLTSQVKLDRWKSLVFCNIFLRKVYFVLAQDASKMFMSILILISMSIYQWLAAEFFVPNMDSLRFHVDSCRIELVLSVKIII